MLPGLLPDASLLPRAAQQLLQLLEGTRVPAGLGAEEQEGRGREAAGQMGIAGRKWKERNCPNRKEPKCQSGGRINTSHSAVGGNE